MPAAHSTSVQYWKAIGGTGVPGDAADARAVLHGGGGDAGAGGAVVAGGPAAGPHAAEVDAAAAEAQVRVAEVAALVDDADDGARVAGREVPGGRGADPLHAPLAGVERVVGVQAGRHEHRHRLEPDVRHHRLALQLLPELVGVARLRVAHAVDAEGGGVGGPPGVEVQAEPPGELVELRVTGPVGRPEEQRVGQGADQPLGPVDARYPVGRHEPLGPAAEDLLGALRRRAGAVLPVQADPADALVGVDPNPGGPTRPACAGGGDRKSVV